MTLHIRYNDYSLQQHLILGKNRIATFWEIAYAKGLRSLHLRTVEVERICTRVMEIGKYVIRGKNQEILDTGKYMVIRKLTNDGWKLYGDIFYSSLDTRSPFDIPQYLQPPEWTFKI